MKKFQKKLLQIQDGLLHTTTQADCQDYFRDLTVLSRVFQQVAVKRGTQIACWTQGVKWRVFQVSRRKRINFFIHNIRGVVGWCDGAG